MEAVIELARVHYPWTIAIGTCFSIMFLSETLHRARIIYPKNVLDADNEYYYWRYRNFFISFIHASITGILSMIITFQQPELIMDTIDTFNETGYILTAFSLGYFFYDSVEMLTHMSYKGTAELILHHFLVISCFSNTVYFRRFVGYNMVALMIEFSNIFLHFRQLLLLSNHPRSTQLYQTNCVINIVFFILVRGGCMFWLWFSLIVSTHLLPWITFITAAVSMVGITFTTTVLFKRLFNADFIIDGCRISRRIVHTPRVPTGTNGVSKQNQTQSEPDLYEAMEDSLDRRAQNGTRSTRSKMVDGQPIQKNGTTVVN